MGVTNPWRQDISYVNAKKSQTVSIPETRLLIIKIILLQEFSLRMQN